jgi:thiol-disulfide isomerase/thioredoxin
MTSIAVAFVSVALAMPAFVAAPVALTPRDAGLGLPAATNTPAAAITQTVPWSATDIDGHAWSGDALRGRVVLIDFWATWCAPCLEDLPRLKRLHARQGAHGLTIIGVSLDRASTRDFRSWLQRQAIVWPQVREAGQYDSPMARRFGVDAIPASYLFDRDGRMQATSLRGQALEARVTALVEAR